MHLTTLLLQAISLYSGRGSTNKVVEWYGELVVVMKAHIHATGFAQCLTERWWDTTHTFHIAEREMTMTPRDFHLTTSLRYDGAIINLEG